MTLFRSGSARLLSVNAYMSLRARVTISPVTLVSGEENAVRVSAEETGGSVAASIVIIVSAHDISQEEDDLLSKMYRMSIVGKKCLGDHSIFFYHFTKGDGCT